MIWKYVCAVLSAGAIVALSVVAFVVGSELLEKLEKLIPPDLPEYTEQDEVRWLNQNWTAGERFWFHHATQGTSTLPVPYEWFVALEQPRIWLFGDPPMFKDSVYLGRFGFIPSPKNVETDDASLGKYGYSPKDKEIYAARTFAYDEAKFAGNPDGLPVGFARLETESSSDPLTGVDLKDDQIGFTCAACHTGQLEFNGISLLIDGAPAMTDLGKFREALGVALIYTKIVPGRFGRFAVKVLGEKYTPKAAEELKEKLAVLLEMGKKLKEITDPVSEHDIEEGFARLDALNRIGNTVFFNDLMEWNPSEEEWVEAVHGVKDNFVPLTAPVNYPQIWDTAWFEWVQYDASIMQPMVRNAGEALGVRAKINLIKPGPRLYRSLVQFDEVYELERLLAGENPWSGERRFKGLRAPEWPADVFGKIDQDKRDRGRELYSENCQRCHLPPPNDPGWPVDEPTVATFWDPVFWTPPNKANERYLEFTEYDTVSKPEFANLVAVSYVGTDPAQAEVMVKRQVRTPLYLRIDPKALCGDPPQGVVTEASFAAALAVVVEKTANKWYDDQEKKFPDEPPDRERMNGYRPNCIQAKMVYKARPLDGIWATAPFLHNGSVPNIYMLLSPVEDRASIFCLGDREYDPIDIGYVLKEVATEEDCAKGKTRIDTSIRGNSNKGHEFRDGKTGDGIIGRFLKEEERRALIEYLKSL